MKEDFLRDSQDHVSPHALEQTNLTLVDEGTVLIVVRGMILARTVPISLTRRRVTINQDLKALLPRCAGVTGEYLWAALTLAASHLLKRVRTAGHGTRKLDTPDLLQFPILVPSPEQLEFVESTVRTHEALGERRCLRQRRISQLFTVLLSRAFTGELTAEWREAHIEQLLQEMEQQAVTVREMR
jgi:type I restriction enzyme S subunit